MKNQRRLLRSKVLTKDEKSILFNLIITESKERNDRVILEEKFTIYFTDLYIKYLIPKDLYKLSKKCHSDFIQEISKITIHRSEISSILNIDLEDCIDTTIVFSKPLIDIRYLYEKDINSVYNLNIIEILIKKLNNKELFIFKDLYYNFMESKKKELEYIQLYKKGYNNFFPNIDTWDSLYKLNRDWYNKLYDYLSSHNYYSFNKTLYDIEINEEKNLNNLMKKVINLINE